MDKMLIGQSYYLYCKTGAVRRAIELVIASMIHFYKNGNETGHQEKARCKGPFGFANDQKTDDKTKKYISLNEVKIYVKRTTFIKNATNLFFGKSFKTSCII